MPPLDTDPPDHRDFRLLLNRFFSRRNLEAHRPAIRAIAAAKLDSMMAKGGSDIQKLFAAPFTAGVLSKVILGLDNDDEFAHVQGLVEAVGTSNAAEAWAELAGFVTDLLEQRKRRVDQSDDVLGAILEGRVAGRLLTEEERLGAATVLLLGGLDTTKAAIGNVIFRMTQIPGLEERIRNPEWERHDLDELLRLDSPVTALARTVVVPTVLGGRQLQPGDHVLVHYGSANRDEAKYDRAGEFSGDRAYNPHVAFGLGIHRCIGSNLARISITAAMSELLGRVEHIRLRADYEVRFSGGGAWYPLALPVTFDLRAADTAGGAFDSPGAE